ncbi:MAG: gliding motility-associated C-terminal domain-containing protein [Bacteroidota bacterium]
MHSLSRMLFTLWLSGLSVFLFSQNVSITYINPPDLTVCDTAVFEVTIANTLADTLSAATFTVEMPDGVEYVPGSMVNAVESNIGNPNSPVFDLPQVPPGESIVLTFSARTRCALIDAINNGDLFVNTYRVDFTGGNTTVLTTPYVVETALLQIVSLNDQMMSGTTGDILTRTWTLVNTRLGALSSLTFIDNYADGIFITSPMGTVVTQNQGTLELELTGADFMMFGDGDGLFELNEQITITETIEVTGCGAPPQSTSFLTAAWGCHGEICQSVSTTGVVAIAPNDDVPNVVSTIIDPFPADYCAAESNQQGIVLTNDGNAAVTDLAVYISHFRDGSMALDPTSLTFTNGGGAPVNAVFDIFNPVIFESCTPPSTLFDSVAIVVPELLPGDTVLILWDAFVCAVDCEAEPPSWRFDWYHDNECPPGSFGSGGAVSQAFGAAQLLSQFVTYYIGEFLVNDGDYTLTYTLKSPILVDSSGTLQIDFNLPCGISWGNNDGFNLNGQTPDSVSVVPGIPGGAEVSMFFELPLGVDSVGSDFNVTFQCDSNCIELPPCIPELITSCPSPPVEGVVGILGVEVNSTLLLNDATCGPQSCEEFSLEYFCEASTDEICPIPIIGYFTSSMEFQRENLGLPDNDNNRFADGAGSLDLGLIRRDRALTGDTLHTTVNGVLTIDNPGETIPNAEVVVNFESHLIDNGWDGGEFMDTIMDISLLDDSTGFVNLGGTITIFDASTGDIFECELPTPRVGERLRDEDAVVNTRPKDIIDLWHFIRYTYDITPAFLRAQGCDLPPGWEFENGDAIEAHVFHRPMYNPNPSKVINMRTMTRIFTADFSGPPGQPLFSCNKSDRRWQLGGYRIGVNPGLYQLPPCAPSNEPGNTFFEFTVARANFFPFEFRSFIDLLEWEYVLPSTVNLLDSKIELLNIQGGAVLLQDVPLAWTQNGQTYDFDISGLPEGLIDEGFFLRFNHEFEMDCSVSEPLPLTINLLGEVAPSLPESNPYDRTEIGNSSLFPIRPALEFFPVNINHESTSNMATWDFEFANLSAVDETALNAWMSVYSPSGLITDFQLTNLSTGQMLPLENGLFQLGDLPPDWMNEFQLTASINNCEPDLVEVTFGWDCEPYTDPMTEPCFQETEILTLTALLGELEMDVQSPVSPFELCDTIGYHTVEIFNAQFGAVYDVELRAALPLGLTILPGTSELEYPSGSGFQPIADPVLLNGDTAFYDLSELSQLLGEQGLQGFTQAPNHSVTIRFRAATECGFITPSQIIFNAAGNQGCGLDANTLSKPGDELFIEGVTPLYDANITIGTNVPPTLSCGDSIQIDVTLEADAPTAGTDSVFIYVPPGLAYQPGSYVPGQNASANDPIIEFVDDQFLLKWPLVDGLQPFTPIDFSLIFAAVAGGECDSTILEIVTFQLQEAECVATGDICSTLAETGRRDLEVIFTIPSLGLSDLELSVDNGDIVYNVQLENNGTATTDDLVVTFYNDVDNSGTFTPGDTPVHTAQHLGGLASGQSVALAGSFPAFYLLLCNVIAVVDNQNNCTCTEDVEAGPTVVPATYAPDTTCLGNELELFFGVPDMNGHTYQWSPSEGLECTDCASPILSTSELSISSFPALIDFDFMDTYPNGCMVDYDFSIFIAEGQPEMEEVVNGCPNEVVPLDGPLGAVTFDWEGPGIIDTTAATQNVVLTDTSTVTLLWTDQFECVNTTNYLINVPEAFLVDTIPLCTGDSVVIDGVTFFDAVEDCNPVIEGICEVTRCLFYEPRDTPVVVYPVDTICVTEGSEIALDQLSNEFVTYNWEPDTFLSCDTCPDPGLLSAFNETFTVTVTDETGCSAMTQVTTIALPPCVGENIQMPNVFTPNGDGINDRFGPEFRDRLDKLVTSAQLRIWDRWGKKVYDGEGISGIYWDGMRSNKTAGQDVYIFMLELSCEEESVTIKGDFTLLR